MVTRRKVLKGAGTVVAAAVAGSVTSASPAYADYTTRINPGVDYGVWEGWGASLAWWTNVFGNNDTLADLFFSRETVIYRGKEYPGLGLNIVRYAAGACTFQPIGSVQMVASPNIWRCRQMEGYWLNWYSSDPNSSSWNWYADSGQRNMMWKARDRGANIFELTSYSPIWWMLNNNNPSGADDGAENLQWWNRRQHAVYLATIAKFAHDRWGVNFSSVEPFNEPSAYWWKSDGPQEGCHVSSGTQQEIIGYLRSELNARGLSWMTIAASDENSYDAATATWNSFPPRTKSMVGRVNVHGYQYGNEGTSRAALHNSVHGPLWQSEYGEGYDHGLYMAHNLSVDLRFLHPTAWCYWQPVDGSTWGLVKATYTDPVKNVGTLGEVTNKYFVLGQYSRHIRQGMLIIDSGDQATVAAYDPGKRKLVLVTVGSPAPKWVTYDLSRFSVVQGLYGTVRRWTTHANENGSIGEQYVSRADVRLNGKTFWAYFEPYAIHTFEIDNVVM